MNRESNIGISSKFNPWKPPSVSPLLTDPLSFESDAIILTCFEKEAFTELLARVDGLMGGSVSSASKEEKFSGKEGKIIVVRTDGKIKPKRLIVIGLGSREEFNKDKNEKIRRISSIALKKARSINCKSVIASVIEPQDVKPFCEGALLGTYKFKKYKKENNEKGDEDTQAEVEAETELENIYLIKPDGEFTEDETNKVLSDIDYSYLLCNCVNLSRSLVNEPGNVINPSTLSEISHTIADDLGLSCEILDLPQLKKMGMGGVIAVGQGSSVTPKFIHISYIPEKPKDKIAIIGKGITFDSGGLSLKPANHITHMKTDKAGACTVLSAMIFIARYKPDVEVHCIVAACENMPSGTAQRPDDIIKMMDGKTVEVVNTDAEGRLTLADAISFACKLGVNKIIDLATLTGACVVALGEHTAGVMGNDEEFIDTIIKTSKKTGERMWYLPFDKDMEDKLKSDVADLKNVGDGYGGAITAGMFLEKFVKDGIKWVHIDIAGPSFTEKGWGYNPKGGTGFGLRTVVEYIMSI